MAVPKQMQNETAVHTCPDVMSPVVFDLVFWFGCFFGKFLDTCKKLDVYKYKSVGRVLICRPRIRI